MKIAKLIIRNIFTYIWFLVLVVCLLGLLLGARYDTALLWQSNLLYDLVFIGKYISWPSDFFVKEGRFILDSPWYEILTFTISLGTCVAVDFLLRKFLWNKIQKTR